MPYPDKVLTDGEEVVAALHPHALTVFWPVVRLLLIIGAVSFGMAMIPVGSNQGPFRLALLCVGVVLVLLTVVRPLMRWRTTHYVITTHRLLHRTGVLSRSGRDIALARITDVTFSQTLWERIIRSGTLWITSAGEDATVWYQVPGSERVQTLLNHMIAEDAERRGGGHQTGGWDTGGGGSGAIPMPRAYVTDWGTREHRTSSFQTDPLY